MNVKTYGIGFTRITAQRAYDGYLVGPEEGMPVACTPTLWVYLDKRGRPARLPEKTAQIWLPDGPEALVSDLPGQHFLTANLSGWSI